jgi:citronellol/citronellal dehydrogenase
MPASPTQKIAIVAGGGSGIGQGCALRLAAMDYHVILVGRTASKLEETAALITAQGGSAVPFPADVRDWDRLGELHDLVADDGIDLLINSAGGQFYALARDISRNGWQAVVETNLSGSFFLCRQLLPALRKRRGAVVTLVANLWQRGAAGMAHSAAARAGVVNLTKSLAIEWASDGIRLNAVSPGLTDTPALRKSYRSLVESVPLQRMGTVDEVVDAVMFMAHAPYITGEVLTIDGGLQLV